MLRNVVIILGLVCASLGAHDIETPDAKAQSVLSYFQLPYDKEGGKIITEIIVNMGTQSKATLFGNSIEMYRLGKKIEHTVHPLRFLGHAFTKPQLKGYMGVIRKDKWKWKSFLGSRRLMGFLKNMTREMQRNNIIPHLYGFSKHVNADYDRLLFYVEREDYEGMVKYLIKH